VYFVLFRTTLSIAVPKYLRPAFFARSPRPGAGLGLRFPWLFGVGVATIRGRRARTSVAFILSEESVKTSRRLPEESMMCYSVTYTYHGY
jgi:hypothetical protein